MTRPSPLREDRRLRVIIAAFFLVGALITATGALALIDDWHQNGRAVVCAILGPVLILIAARELVHRVRYGPQEPGRRVRDQ